MKLFDRIIVFFFAFLWFTIAVFFLRWYWVAILPVAALIFIFIGGKKHV